MWILTSPTSWPTRHTRRGLAGASGKTSPSWLSDCSGLGTDASFLAAKAREEIEDNGEQHTEQNRCAQGKVHGHVLAPIRNVSWKLAQRNTGPAQQQQQSAGNHQYQSQPNEQPAQVVHAPILQAAENLSLCRNGASFLEVT